MTRLLVVGAFLLTTTLGALSLAGTCPGDVTGGSPARAVFHVKHA